MYNKNVEPPAKNQNEVQSKEEKFTKNKANISKTFASNKKVSDIITNKNNVMQIDQEGEEDWSDIKGEYKREVKKMKGAELVKEIKDHATTFLKTQKELLTNPSKDADIMEGKKETAEFARRRLEILNKELLRRENLVPSKGEEKARKGSDTENYSTQIAPDIATIEDTYDEYMKKSGATERKVIRAIEKLFGIKHVEDDILATDSKYQKFRDYYSNQVTYHLLDYRGDEDSRLMAIDDAAKKFGINIDKNGNVWEGVKYDVGINEERMERFERDRIGTLEKIFDRKSSTTQRGKNGNKSDDRTKGNLFPNSTPTNNERDNRGGSPIPKGNQGEANERVSSERTLSGGVQRLTNPVKGNVGNDVYYTNNKKRLETKDGTPCTIVKQVDKRPQIR